MIGLQSIGELRSTNDARAAMGSNVEGAPFSRATVVHYVNMLTVCHILQLFMKLHQKNRENER